MSIRSLSTQFSQQQLPNTRLRNKTSVKPHKNFFESLEERVLFSESASAQFTLVASTGSGSSTVYNYNVTLQNTGTTPIGTFWMGWVPGANLLPSAPASESSPSGWTPTLVGPGNTTDGASVQWVAQNAGSDVAPGASLTGFGFSTADNPIDLEANSIAHTSTAALTSFVYGGAPFSDDGFQFVVSPTPNGTATSVISLNASATTINSGDSVGFTAIVGRTSSATPAPTGFVSFLDDGAFLGAESLGTDGTASFSTTTLAGGAQNITAVYSGDPVYASSTSSAVAETVNVLGVAPTIAKSTLPATVVGGQPAHGAMTIGLTNETNVLVGGSIVLNVYASTDGKIDSSSVQIGKVVRPLKVHGSSIAPVALQIKSLPSTLAAGTYTLLARATDPASQVIDSTTGPTLTVQAPIISLTESLTKMTLPAEVTAPGKERATAAIRITNGGNITSAGATTLTIYASTTGIVDSSAIAIAHVTKSLHIRAGKFAALSIALHALPAIPSGTYFIVAQVTDPMQQLSSVASSSTIAVTT